VVRRTARDSSPQPYSDGAPSMDEICAIAARAGVAVARPPLTEHRASVPSARSSQHGYECRRRADLYRAERLETVAAVEGNVSRVGGFQVGRHLVAVAPRERVGHQRIAVTFALMRRIHPDQRQVPVRLARMVLRHLLENGANVVARRRDRTLELSEPFLVGMNSGWEPQRNSDVIVRTPGAIVRESAASQGTDKSRHAGQVLVRMRPRPARHRVRRKCQDDGFDCRTFVLCAYGSYRGRLQAILPAMARSETFIIRACSLCRRDRHMTDNRFAIVEAPPVLGLFPKGLETLPAVPVAAGLAERRPPRRPYRATASSGWHCRFFMVRSSAFMPSV
jgi:CxxC motif-containing protein